MRHGTRLVVILLMIAGLLNPVFVISSQDTSYEDWDAVLLASSGTTVRVGIGLEAYSALDYISTYYQERLASDYGITFEIVPLPYADFVEQVEAARLDAFWLTRRDLYRLYRNNQLYRAWTALLPNQPYINFERMSITEDVGGEITQSTVPAFDVRFQLVYNTAVFDDPAAVPRTLDALTTWIEQNPGQFTYITPESLYGDVFLQQLLILLSGGATQWQGAFDETLYQRWSPALWDLLNRWKPDLWDQGRTYPHTINQAHALLNNGETTFSFALSQGGALVAIADGEIPSSASALLLDGQSVGDFVYFAIPVNTSNPAGAMVIANFLLEPRNQANQLLPSNGFGFGHVLALPSLDRVTDVNAFSGAFSTLSSASPSPAALNAAAVTGVAPEYAIRLRSDWYLFVSGD